MPEDGEHQPEFYFDLSSGQLLIGRVALSAHIEASGHPADITELGLFLRSDIPIADEHKTFMGPDSVNIEDYKVLGRWLSNLPKGEKEAPLTKYILERAGQLGLIPTIKSILNTFTTASNFYQVLELHNVRRRGLYKDQSVDDIADYVSAVFETRTQESLFRELTERSYRGENLGPDEITEITGMTLSELLELRGHVYNIRWPRERYESWCVEFMHANSGNEPTRSAIDYLSANNRGPSRFGIRKFFGNMSNFRAAGREAYIKDLELRALERADKLRKIDEALRSQRLHPVLFADAAAGSDPIVTYAQLEVVRALLPNLPLKKKYIIASSKSPGKFIDVILAFDNELTAMMIEETARSLGVHEDIWPMDDYLEVLRVPDLH